MDFVTALEVFRTGMTWENYVMIIIALALLYLGIAKRYEPLLLVPISIGIILANVPAAELAVQMYGGEGMGFLDLIREYLIKTEVIPLLIFLGLGALTDFRPLIANPISFLLGAAAQVGVFITLIGALYLGFSLPEAASIAIIGGADGPTTIYVASKLIYEKNPALFGAVVVSAYMYMAMVPLIQPPIIRAMVPKKLRAVEMKPLREPSKLEVIMFPIMLMLVTALLVPKALPIIAMIAAGNLMKECGVTEVVQRLAKTAANELMNIAIIFLGLGVGGTLVGPKFLRPETLLVFALGLFAFAAATFTGVLFGLLLYFVTGGKINPVIGAAGVSAVPMSARVCEREVHRVNPRAQIIMHAMGPNVAGVIGTAIVAGVFLSLITP